jgi:transposase
MTRKAYPTDLNDKAWAVIEPYVPQPKTGGRPAEHERREILNAIAYALRSGCAWRLMPHDLPPWSTVYDYFRQWRADGTWERIGNIHSALGRDQHIPGPVRRALHCLISLSTGPEPISQPASRNS